MQINTISPYTPPVNNAPRHFEVCASYNGIFYIHAVSTEEQNVMSARIEAFRNIMPNAEINTVTYNNATLPQMTAVLTETLFNDSGEKAHLLITSGLVADKDRSVHSTDLVIAFKQAGIVHYATNFANLAVNESISMQCAKAILGLD